MHSYQSGNQSNTAKGFESSLTSNLSAMSRRMKGIDKPPQATTQRFTVYSRYGREIRKARNRWG
jgi:hypothetical protein